MSDSVFRPLFVELGEDAFAIAKGIAEQAVKQALDRAKPTGEIDRLSRMLGALSDGPGARHLASRYGWTEHRFSRPPYDRAVYIRAELRCGHVVRLEPVSELALMLASHGEMLHTFIDLLDRRANEARYCYCVPCEEAA